MTTTDFPADIGFQTRRAEVGRSLRRATRFGFALLALVLAYLTYTGSPSMCRG